MDGIFKCFFFVFLKKVLEETPLRSKVRPSFCHPWYIREIQPQHYGIQKKDKPKGFKKSPLHRMRTPHLSI